MTRIRRTLARWLRRAAQWLSPEPTVAPEVLAAARAVVRETDTVPHTSAYKRALAFKALAARFPRVPRRDLGLAIELAVREVVPQ